jgi:hypothetical protein
VRLPFGDSRDLNSKTADHDRLGKGQPGLRKTHMPRPRRIQEPAKINLLIEKDIKLKAIELATKRRTSVGRLFEKWVMEDLNGSQPKNSSSEE